MRDFLGDDNKLEAFLAMNHPWSTIEVLKKLVLAAEHLLSAHACDVHGHEEIRAAARLGRERLVALGIEMPVENTLLHDNPDCS